METIIQIHEDYCADVGAEEILAILAEITALVSEAVLRFPAEEAA